MAMLSSKAAYPSSYGVGGYRLPTAREHHGFFASPTESEFSDHFEAPNSIRNWDETRVAEWLRSINCPQYVELFTINNVTGSILMELDRNHLRDMGVKKVGDQIRIASQAKNFRTKEFKPKSLAASNRGNLAILDSPQLSPKPSITPRFQQSSRMEKRMSRQISDYNYAAAASQFSASKSSRPSSPHLDHAQSSRRGYGGMSPQRDQHGYSNGVSSRAATSETVHSASSSRYGVQPRSATAPSETAQQSGRYHHVRASPSVDSSVTNSSILPQDKPLIRVIFDTGRSCVVSIDGCDTVDKIMFKTLRKGSLNEAHVKNYCFYVLDGTEPNPALVRRINDAEVMRICSDRTRLERNRLILRKIHMGEPDDDQLKAAAGIAAQIQIQQQSNVIVPNNARSQMKVEKLTGESLAPVSYPQSPASAKERERHIYAAQQDLQRPVAAPLTAARVRRIKEHFGGRPPSELIASDLSTYFPDFEKDQIDKTVRMSVRRSRRISRATSRLSTVSNISLASSLRDAPPLPSISDALLRSEAGMSKDKGPRPLSVLRLGGGFRDSITSSVLEPLDEESPLDAHRKSFASFSGQSDTLGGTMTDNEGSTVGMSAGSYYDDGRSSVANSSLSGEGGDSLNKRLSQLVHEDSEESDEELTQYLENDSWDNIKYMKGALIGKGSFGSVYLALHAVTGELMAVKQVEMPSSTAHTTIDAKKNNMVEALKHEIGLLRELRHANIVQYLGSNSDDTHLNIFLEYVPGGSVATMLVNYGPLGENLIANFVRQILKGLAYLHSRDIIHRDIKGANILVDNKGSVKISDFGISKRVDTSTLLTSGGGAPSKGGRGGGGNAAHRVSMQGSVFWMAPEVVKQTAYTRKADIWSLGCLIIEMFTGSHPHPNCTQLQAIFKIGGSDDASPTVPPEASEDMRAFCRRTFELVHERRPEAEELLRSRFVVGVGGLGK